MITRDVLIEYISRSAVIATSIVIPTNIASLAIAFIITRNEAREDMGGILMAALALCAISDIAAGLIIKRSFLSQLLKSSPQNDPDAIWRTILKISLIIAALCSLIPLYGLVMTILGTKIEVAVGFSLVSLIGFMFLRVRPRDFERLNISV